MILSDRTIREELAGGRIVIEPVDQSSIQPSSVDLHLDRFFRVFLNHTMGHIDVKQNLEELTELVEIERDGVFMLHPGEFVLGSTLERVALPDDLVARLEGKALAVDTPVPTPSGWTTMGDLRVGDLVFDEHGSPTAVIGATSPLHGRPCREVVFSDGTSVVADLWHQWETVDKNGRRYGRRRGRVVTTAEIERTLVVRTERNHQIPLAPPVQYSTKDLPVDPYALGIWLGDGTSAAAEVTCCDAEVLGEIEAAGYSVAPQRTRPHTYRIGGCGHSRDPATGRYGRNESLSSALRDLGLLGNKHVPRIYLEADIAQRTALLEGLMDSDGYVDEFGRCEFVSIHEPLADALRELAASLGFRPVVSKGRAKLYGVDCGPKYMVKFTPDRPVFRLPRKLVRLGYQRQWLHSFRAIAAVREVPSVPVRCIEVESPRGLFLVSESFIATHNSSLGRLGLLIHSSLPGDELVSVGSQGHATSLPIREVVRRRLTGPIVGFDPLTLRVAVYAITGWYEGPPDRIFEVRLESGRSVRVTAGHNLFTPDGNGNGLRRVRTLQITRGTPVAVSPSQSLDEPALGGGLATVVMKSTTIVIDRVLEVVDTGRVEPVFDLEVRPDGRHIENFLAGSGVFVSNTAGFVDAGWDGHLTLELSNVANLPITLYPGMKIGQISFLRMTTPADVPYGSKAIGSKYQGQRGPTASRYWENFRKSDEGG